MVKEITASENDLSYIAEGFQKALSQAGGYGSLSEDLRKLYDDYETLSAKAADIIDNLWNIMYEFQNKIDKFSPIKQSALILAADELDRLGKTDLADKLDKEAGIEDIFQAANALDQAGKTELADRLDNILKGK